MHSGLIFFTLLSSIVYSEGKTLPYGTLFMGMVGPLITPSVFENSNTVGSSVLASFSNSNLVFVANPINCFYGNFTFNSFHFPGTLVLFNINIFKVL